ncbi:MAG TPA: caspase family protein [Hyphomicrobiaceae bacterium]|nr:caspase family protein [Hyphomicrobiaceae bacterium]
MTADGHRVRSRSLARSLLAGIWLALAMPALAQSPPLRGVALVIGESRYDALPTLANPGKDARDIDRLLGDLGFEVDRLLNAGGPELRQAIARFEADAKGADVALIYYSGHGIEAGGENFIAPTDTDLTSPAAAGQSMIAVQPILDDLAKIVPVSIVLLDACRSDPFPPGQTILLPGDAAPRPVEGQGLAAIRGPTPVASRAIDPQSLGAVIGFSASPGQPALDGPPGGNSPYAAALLKHFAAGGYSFGDVMTMVSEEVYLKTGAKQLPWTSSSLRRVLTFSAAETQSGDADEAAIRTERRKLLLSIAGTPAPTRKYVETLASEQKVPLDALYGMLDVLGIKAGTDGGDLEQQLKQGAERLKELLATKAETQVKSDPELERLGRLADDAEAEGAIALALKYRDEASARADALLAGRQAEAARIRQDMADIARTYSDNAATALLNFDHLHAAELYGKAFEAVKDWDMAAAVDYKIKQGDALQDEGFYTSDNQALIDSITAYGEAETLAPRQADPASWAKAEDRIGQAQQVLGERQADDGTLNASIASYQAALTVRTRDAMPKEWAATQNNLANALYTMGHRKRDIPMLARALEAFDAASEVLNERVDPVGWATIVNNKGSTLLDLAEFTYAASNSAEMAAYAAGNRDATNIPEVVKSRETATAYLDAAIGMLEEALTVRTRADDALDWAMLQHTLGTAYEQRGDMNHAPDDLKRSIAAYRAALEVHTRDRTPAQWMETSNNLAIALKALAEETKDPAPIREAVALYRAVLEITSRQSRPLDWADYEQNLGQGLAALADYEDALPNLQAAEAAFRAAGEVTTLDRGIAKWQGLQTALSTTLLLEGLKGRNREKALEAQAVAFAIRDKLVELGQPDDPFFSQYLPMIDQVLNLIPQ